MRWTFRSKSTSTAGAGFSARRAGFAGRWASGSHTSALRARPSRPGGRGARGWYERLTGGETEITSGPPLSELQGGARSGGSASLDTLLDVSLPVAIEFGRTTMTIQEVLELGNGSVIELSRMVGEPVDIFVSDRKLAEGEVVVVGEHFGVRITRILSIADPVMAN